MKKIFLSLLAIAIITSVVNGQQTKLWSEKDRQYLLDNLTRSRDLVIKETQNLSSEQWNFKESPDRWSINQVIEHINIYELFWQREVNMALGSDPRPDPAAYKSDSVYLGYIMEEVPHVTTEFTKPFTYSVPLGLNDGKNNVRWFTKMRNESIDYIKNVALDLRVYALKPGRPNLHQLYIYVFGHTDRHLRQIMKIKQHPRYPR